MSLRMVSVLLLLVGLVGTSCSMSPSGSPARSSCDGIGAGLGGCDSNLPEFSATDCVGVAQEFGTALDERTLAVITGPEAVDGNARSVRLTHAMVLVSDLANRHLRATGLHADCDVPEFMGAAEAEFSSELRDSVGAFLYDGRPPATYDEWLEQLNRNIVVIDQEE